MHPQTGGEVAVRTGHYVALVKSGGVWLLYEDDSVEPVSEATVAAVYGNPSELSVPLGSFLEFRLAYAVNLCVTLPCLLVAAQPCSPSKALSTAAVIAVPSCAEVVAEQGCRRCTAECQRPRVHSDVPALDRRPSCGGCSCR